MKLTRYLFLSLLAWSSLAVAAQEISLEGIKLQTEYPARKVGKQVNVDMIVDITEMPRMSAHQQRIITPVLQARNGAAEVAMPSFVLAGCTRYMLIKRRMDLDKNYQVVPGQTDETQIIARKNRKEQHFQYRTTIGFQPWMKDATLVFRAADSGCADCPLGSAEKQLAYPALFPLYEANYSFGIIVPDGELVKDREETLSSFISFVVGKYDILPNFKSNAAELARVHAKLSELGSNEDVILRKLQMVGYASPEGGIEYNEQLSRNRVEAYAKYLSAKYPMLKGLPQTSYKGADWEGLAKAVSAMDFPERDQVLDIIAKLPVGERTPALRAIDGGRVYAMLLELVYPSLRRTELVFSIEVKGFSLEKAKKVIKTHPSRLSLAEVYAVANSYPAGSKEQYETWEIADAAFPKEVIPAINLTVLDLNAGRANVALARLERRSSEKRLFGMLGLAYAYCEQWEKAEYYLREAAKNGDKQAAHNLEELRKYVKDNF